MVGITSFFHLLSAIVFVGLFIWTGYLVSEQKRISRYYQKQKILGRIDKFLISMSRVYGFDLELNDKEKKTIVFQPKNWISLFSQHKITKVSLSSKPNLSCHIFLNGDKIEIDKLKSQINGIQENINININ